MVATHIIYMNDLMSLVFLLVFQSFVSVQVRSAGVAYQVSTDKMDNMSEHQKLLKVSV